MSANALAPYFARSSADIVSGASKTTSRASVFEQIFPFYLSRLKNFKILEVGQVMILRKVKP